MGFPTKNDHFGVFWVIPPFKETSMYTYIIYIYIHLEPNCDPFSVWLVFHLRESIEDNVTYLSVFWIGHPAASQRI